MIDETTGSRTGNPYHPPTEQGSSFAHELDTPTVKGLEQRAMAYLDTADAALAAFNDYADYLITTHPENFLTTDMNDAEVAVMATFGTSVQQKAKQAARGSIPAGKGIVLPRELKDLMPTYSGLEGSKVFTDMHDIEIEQQIEDLTAQAPLLSEEKAELDTYVNELDVAGKDIPAIRDTSVVLALSFVRLAQFFQQDAVKQNLPANPALSSGFEDVDPASQGGYLALSYYASRDMDAFRKALQNLLSYYADDPDTQERVIDEHLAEVLLVEQRMQIMKDCHHKIGVAYKTVIDTALKQAVRTMHELIEIMPSPGSIDATANNTASVLEAEKEGISVNRRVARRSKHIIEVANSLRAQGVFIVPAFSLSQPFPTTEAKVANHVKQLEAAKATGAIAARQAAELENKQTLITELTNLQAPYRMTRSDVKGVPSSNDLTGALIKGEVGDEEFSAEAVAKEDAYDIAGLVLQLNGQLDSKTRNVVFDRLFEAYEKEEMLLEQIGENAADFRLATACDWLINNVSSLQSSELEIVRRLGDELALYGRTHRTPIGQRLERAARQISAQTLAMIEALRTDVEPLDIRAFPPGISNRKALEEDALEIATRPGSQKIPIIDEARLLAIDDLSVAYSETDYDTQLFRLLPGSLKERFPYYALVISAEGRKVIVAENPKTNNATYVLEELDPKLATWQEMIQLDKRSVRELGGRAMRHDPKRSLQEHFKRVNDEVALRLSS